MDSSTAKQINLYRTACVNMAAALWEGHYVLTEDDPPEDFVSLGKMAMDAGRRMRKERARAESVDSLRADLVAVRETYELERRLHEHLRERFETRGRQLLRAVEDTERQVCNYICRGIGMKEVVLSRGQLTKHLQSVVKAADACGVDAQARRERDAADPTPVGSDDTETYRCATSIEQQASAWFAVLEACPRSVYGTGDTLKNSVVAYIKGLQLRVSQLERAVIRAESIAHSITSQLGDEIAQRKQLEELMGDVLDEWEDGDENLHECVDRVIAEAMQERDDARKAQKAAQELSQALIGRINTFASLLNLPTVSAEPTSKDMVQLNAILLVLGDVVRQHTLREASKR